jgi:hypothetical protein
MMSSGAQVDLDWAGTDTGKNAVAAPPAIAPTTGAVYQTDEEILGIDPNHSAPSHHTVIPSEARNLSSIDNGSADEEQRDSSGKDSPRNDNVHEISATAAMPEWMRTVAADPKHQGEAQQLWREHQEFRAAFSSPEEARAIKELLPGGVKDVLTLREATQSVDRIDAAIFSGNARAQSEVVAELARTNPAAFRSMFAEAAKVLAGMGQVQEAGSRGQGAGKFAADPVAGGAFALGGAENRRQDAGATTAAPGANPDSRFTTHDSQIANHPSQEVRASQSSHFDPAAYTAFERATNDSVARDVRGSINDTLARVMPDGVADGAARRISEDIFNEVHRALASDQALSQQVAEVLRDRRFGAVEQQRVASLLAGRAKQLVPSMARRIIGEWTSTVLNTARSKAARQAAAASRVDIAAPGGSLDSMPLRQMSAREVNYTSMSDEEILGI